MGCTPSKRDKVQFSTISSKSGSKLRTDSRFVYHRCPREGPATEYSLRRFSHFRMRISVWLILYKIKCRSYKPHIVFRIMFFERKHESCGSIFLHHIMRIIMCCMKFMSVEFINRNYPLINK